MTTEQAVEVAGYMAAFSDEPPPVFQEIWDGGLTVNQALRDWIVWAARIVDAAKVQAQEAALIPREGEPSDLDAWRSATDATEAAVRL